MGYYKIGEARKSFFRVEIIICFSIMLVILKHRFIMEVSALMFSQF